jgi:signal transduction histidine kinase
VPNIAKVDSPMIAMGKYLKHTLGDDHKIVFIGPCVAKKSEYIDEEVEGVIDSVLTFGELNEIFDKLRIDLDNLENSQLDPPHAYIGKSFPLAGGLLKTSDISNDVLAKEVIVVEGKQKVVDIIEDIAEGHIKSKFVDILFCEGCINGPAIDSDLNYYSKRESVINFINENIQNVDKQVWKSDIYNSRMIDFSREFKDKNQRRPMPTEEKIREILAKTNKYEKQDELNCGACGYHTCRDYAIAIAKGLAEEEMCLPYLIDKLENAYKELKETQEQLHNAEKLASIGQLASGVAHEINNPLGTIMLYSSMLKRELEKKADDASTQKAEDLKLIIDEANRCKGIVSNLLNFARHGKLKIAEVNISEVVNSAVKNVSVNPEFEHVSINVNDNSKHKIIEADEDQIKQVFLNILNNACEAVEDSDIKNVAVNIKEEEENIIVEISDTGSGISEENKKKLFTPFFTTKKMGKGTGLGLAISYGIIKMHKGDIKVKSNVGSGSVFSIKLPFKSPSNIAESNLEELFTNGTN